MSTRVIEGSLEGAGLRIAIVVARFNETITQSLLDGCVRALRRHGVREDDTTVVWVPGSFELGTAAMVMAKSMRYDAIVCLGCIIRGSTSHYDHVAAAATSGISRVGAETGVPCIFAVVTAENHEQAFDRAGLKGGNRGADAAASAIEMATLVHTLQSPMT